MGKKMFFGGAGGLDSKIRLMFSVRKIVPSYDGQCMRVKRSSDNTEEDFGFDVSGLLDTSAILTFVGGGDGIVKTWYNQARITLNATDFNNNNNCFIVQSGVLVTALNGLPAIKNTASTLLGLGVNEVILTDDFDKGLETIYKVETTTAINEGSLRGGGNGYITMFEGSFTRFQTRRNTLSYLPTPFPGRNIVLLLALQRTSLAGSGNIKCWGNATDFGFGDMNNTWTTPITYVTSGVSGNVQEIQWYQESQLTLLVDSTRAEINSYFTIY